MTNNETDRLMISDCMDGELSVADLDKKLAIIEKNNTLKEQWSRYHLIKSALQDEDVQISDSIADLVMQKINNNEKKSHSSHSLNFIQKFWLEYTRPIYAFSSIVVVGLITVLLWPVNINQNGSQPTLTIANNQVDLQQVTDNVVGNSENIVPDPVLSERLKVYLAKHGETSFQKHRSGGFVPYSPGATARIQPVYARNSQVATVNYSQATDK